MKKGIPILVTILGIFLLWGCYPQGPDYIEEMDVVITYHKDTYDFASKATYAMPDRIVKITVTWRKAKNRLYPDASMRKSVITKTCYPRIFKVDVSADPDLLSQPGKQPSIIV
jgi:hypothetical protein